MARQGVLVMVGTDHRRAAIAMRERLAFDPARLRAALTDLGGHVREGMILSTCNRTEVYAFVDPGDNGAVSPEGPIFAFLRSHCRADTDELASATTVRAGEDATLHLFRVACGLESLVLGEPQILGQLRDALAAARAANMAGPALSRLATDALRIGKRARSDTAIVRNHLTVPHAALSLAAAELGGLRGRSALVLGAGEMGDLTAKLLRSAGVRSIVIANRSRGRAAELADTIGGRTAELDEVPTLLAEVDAVFGAAGADRYLVDSGALAVRASVRRDRVVLVDMAVPRAFDPAIRGIDGVVLFDVDDLATPAAAFAADYQAEIARVESMVTGAVGAFSAWCRGRGAAPTILALRQATEAVRRQELARVLGRLGHLSERDRQVVASLSTGLVNKLLHHTLTTLQSAEPNQLAVTRTLFGLADDPAPAAPDDARMLVEPRHLQREGKSS